MPAFSRIWVRFFIVFYSGMPRAADPSYKAKKPLLPPRRHLVSRRRGGGIASSNGGGNAVLERTRNGGSAKAAEVCAPCTTFMRNEIGCSLFCGDETIPQIFWIRHSFFMLFVSNPLCSEKLQLKLRHSLDKREECGTMGVR